jgi:hypothetical protein
MGFPRFADSEWDRNAGGGTWNWQDPVVEYNWDFISIGQTVFSLAEFQRAIKNFTTQFRNASSGPAKISNDATVELAFRTSGEPGRAASYLSVEFVFALGYGAWEEVSSGLSAEASTNHAHNRLLGEIDYQVSTGRYNRATIERLVAEFSSNIQRDDINRASHKEEADRQD